MSDVGPGKYAAQEKNKGIMNPSIPRQGRAMMPLNQRRHKEAVSIRDGFEEYDDDDETL
jgi:hypothetical protein